MGKKPEKQQMEIAGRLLWLRLRMYKSASAMARDCHMSPQSWYNYESGRVGLDHKVASVVVERTGVDYNWLYSGRVETLERHIRQMIKGEGIDDVKPARRKQQGLPKPSEISRRPHK